MESPNYVIIISVDALRARNLGCYGYEHDVSPRIDELADESTLFRQSYSCINNTDPSITSIHSGIHPTASVMHQGGRVNNKDKRRAEALPWMPEVVSRQEGHRSVYTGHALGRWHRRGFNHVPSTRPTHERRLLFHQDEERQRIRAFLNQVSPSFSDIVSNAYYRVEQGVGKFTEQLQSGFGDDESGDEIDTLINQIDTARTAGDSLYAYTHLTETHTPYDADEALIEQYLTNHSYPNRPLEAVSDPDKPECAPIANVPYTEGWFTDRDYEVGTARWYARYDACVTEADQKVGRVVDALSDRNLLEDTLLVVLADHGESLEEHGMLFSHAGLHDPCVEIPLIVRPPGGHDDEVDEFVQLIDISPTVLDTLDIPYSEYGFHGQSLLPLVGCGEDWQSRDALLFEEANSQRRRAIRTRKYKYIYALDGEQHDDQVTCRYCGHDHWPKEELYDLENDPGEKRNIANDRSDLTSQLRTHAEELASEYSHPSDIGEQHISYDDEEIVAKRLKRLGYK